MRLAFVVSNADRRMLGAEQELHVLAAMRARGVDARLFRMQDIAEPEQLDLLAKEGCQYFQGYLCSGPIDSQALVRLVGGATNA